MILAPTLHAVGIEHLIEDLKNVSVIHYLKIDQL